MSNEEYRVEIGGRLTDIAELKVNELKIELKKRGLSTTGTKKNLYDKLKDFIIKNSIIAAEQNKIEQKNDAENGLTQLIDKNKTEPTKTVDSNQDTSVQSINTDYESESSFLNANDSRKRINIDEISEEIINVKKSKTDSDLKTDLNEQPLDMSVPNRNVNDLNVKNEEKLNENEKIEDLKINDGQTETFMESEPIMKSNHSSPLRRHSNSESKSNNSSRSNSVSRRSESHSNSREPSPSSIENENKKQINSAKSPSRESSKSESAFKEVPMSGDRNRFSRSKSPKRRWHASPTPDPDIELNTQENLDDLNKNMDINTKNEEILIKNSIVNNELNDDKCETLNQYEQIEISISDDKIQDLNEDINLKSVNEDTNKFLINENNNKNDEMKIIKNNDESTFDLPKIQRKRKWFNSDSLKVTTIVNISSDTLKNYLLESKTPKISTETETILNVENVDVNVNRNVVDMNENSNGATRRSFKTEDSVLLTDQNEKQQLEPKRQSSRTVIIEEENNELIYEDALNTHELNKSNTDIKETNEIKENANIEKSKKESNDNYALNIDEPERVGDASPSHKPLSNIIHIKGLTRPFTVSQLKEVLTKYGKLNEKLFWMNNVKSHCYAAYETIEEAKTARDALHRTKWPLSNPRTLRVDFATEDEVLSYQQDNETTIKITSESKKQKVNEEPVNLRKTEKRDKVISLPEKMNQKENKEPAVKDSVKTSSEKQSRQRSTSRNRDTKTNRKETNTKRNDKQDKDRPVREWDLPKLKSSRSRSRDISMERRRKDHEKRIKDKNIETKKEEEAIEEAPVKLLDDLFRKTKATPYIYWLPLTDEQILEKQQQREKRMQERKQREIEREKERHENRNTTNGIHEENKRNSSRKSRSRSGGARRQSIDRKNDSINQKYRTTTSEHAHYESKQKRDENQNKKSSQTTNAHISSSSSSSLSTSLLSNKQKTKNEDQNQDINRNGNANILINQKNKTIDSTTTNNEKTKKPKTN